MWSRLSLGTAVCFDRFLHRAARRPAARRRKQRRRRSVIGWQPRRLTRLVRVAPRRHPAGGRAVAGSNPVSPIRESPAFGGAFVVHSSPGRHHGVQNGVQTQGCVSLNLAGWSFARVYARPAGRALTPERPEARDTRIMIPPLLGSAAGFEGPGGHRKGTHPQRPLGVAGQPTVLRDAGRPNSAAAAVRSSSS